MNKILEGNNNVPAKFNLSMEQVQSKDEMALSLGMNVETLTAKAGAALDFSTEKEYNRFLVKMTQEYYTVSFDLPTSQDQIFDPTVTPEDLERYIQPNNPATFISSVSYGRIFHMLIESTSSVSEMNAKLKLSYGSPGTVVDGEIDVESFKSLKEVKIKVFAYGGDAAGSFKLVGESTIEGVADRLAESTDVLTGLPISYVVRSVEDPSIVVGTKISTDIELKECELKGVLPPTNYQGLVDLFDDGIGAMVNIKGSDILAFSKAGNEYAWYNVAGGETLGKFGIKDPNGPIGESAFDAIGAGVNFKDGSLYLFNGPGSQFQILRFNPADLPDNGLPNSMIGEYRKTDGAPQILNVDDAFGDSKNFPFAGEGFAAVNRIGATKMHYFGGIGDRYAEYNFNNNGIWSPDCENQEKDTDMKDCLLRQDIEDGVLHLFKRVGAATRISFGGTNRYLYINSDGDELMIRISTPERKYDGPYVIN